MQYLNSTSSQVNDRKQSPWIQPHPAAFFLGLLAVERSVFFVAASYASEAVEQSVAPLS